MEKIPQIMTAVKPAGSASQIGTGRFRADFPKAD
jgi:hypothetical protein